MADKINVAIVGLGVGRSRARFAAESDNVNLKVVCALEEVKAKAAAEEFGCEWSTSLDDVLARDDIDAVGVFTPSGTHCQYAIESIKAGKHTFTTKPMDIRVEQCDAAIKAAEEAGVILAVDFGNRYVRVNHQVKTAIDTGMLGKVSWGTFG
jgi:predicted dehydrogenase